MQSIFILCLCLCAQLYTLSQDGVLCVWNSDTELDGLVLKRKTNSTAKQEMDQAEEEEKGEEGQEEVIRGKVGGHQDEKSKNVRYRLVTK